MNSVRTDGSKIFFKRGNPRRERRVLREHVEVLGSCARPVRGVAAVAAGDSGRGCRPQGLQPIGTESVCEQRLLDALARPLRTPPFDLRQRLQAHALRGCEPKGVHLLELSTAGVLTAGVLTAGVLSVCVC